ncbi:MAG: hypothetical protein HXY40_02775 [Chloroflexi bacterium]|nr:hypothetical protein [Chloroflexota bacterium]
MRLDEYQWSRNPRGLHNIGAFMRPLDITRYSRPQFGWAKLVSENVEFVEDAATLLAQNITPVVRVYLTPEQNAQPLAQQAYSLVAAYAAVGVKWFELYNEPNLPVEWPGGTQVDYRNTGMIASLVDRWMTWAEYVASLGCYPGFISLAETDVPALATVRWVDALFGYVAQAYYQRFVALLNNGLWYATHPYVLNHFYQEVPGGGPTSARPAEGLNNREPGWHFEYPYDPICQASDPGRTVYGGTPQTPNGDPVGLIATGMFMNERSSALFGSQAVPVLGTEGGIDLPDVFGGEIQRDIRYPPATQFSNGQGTVAMFEWSALNAPAWFFGSCIWKEDLYYRHGGYALEQLERIAPIYKNVPAVEVMGGGGQFVSAPTLPPPGPGPIHGAPNFHMVLLAPGLEARWFFDTAFAYWSVFRPIVTTFADWPNYFNYTRSLAITVIATPESADLMRESISAAYPNILFDLIVVEDNLDSVAQLLNARAQRNARFG